MVCGSSPRVRGTRPQPAPDRRRARFIPARAGNALIDLGDRAAVHPRACGERASTVDGRIDRARFIPARAGNAQTSPTCCSAVDRFIPARAGNAWQSHAGRPLRVAPVHPRACGERPRDAGPQPSSSGSSPRVRGTRATSSRCRAVTRRFIPARAGNAAAPPVMAPSPVHPRACGERHGVDGVSARCAGSSPRVRGTQRRV